MKTYSHVNNELINNLLSDKVLLHTTDTVWGLCVSLHSEKAYQQIYKIKDRTSHKPLLLLVNSIAMLKDYVSYIHPRIETLLEVHTRPLTVIYPKSEKIPSHILTPDDTIAIRIIKDLQTNEIISNLGHPVCSSSANREGDPTPKEFKDINQSILSQIDLLLHPSEEQKNLMTYEPSVIIKFDRSSGELEFIRE